MATLYCGPSGTGSANGSNFSNLLALPDTTGFTRGNVYIVVDGSYGSKTLSTAASGSTTITIKKASAADSAVTGYSSALHDGEAIFGDITISTAYWVLNGVTRTETTAFAAPAGYGFRATSIASDSSTSQNANYSEFYYMDLGGAWASNPSAGTIATYPRPCRFVYNQTGIKVSRCHIHNGEWALVGAHGTTGMIIEHCTFAYGYGKEAIAAPNAGLNGLIVRYCRFLNSTQRDPNDETSGLTAEIGIFGNDLPIDDVEIYGNWFSSSITGQQRNAIIALGGLGFNSYPSNCKIFNNTFVDIAADGTAYSAITAGGGSGTEARNNLFYNSGSTSVSANTTSNNVTASSNPFVDYSGKDFRITSSNDARNAGTSLGSTYNTDPLGVTRGADGTWDVGAFEYDDGGGSPPSAPSNFRLA